MLKGPLVLYRLCNTVSGRQDAAAYEIQKSVNLRLVRTFEADGGHGKT